jgi:glycogen(starch) synthase
MRVIQLGPFPPPQGGVQTNLVAIRDHLRANGHSAAVIHLTRHRRENADEVFYPKTAAETMRLLLAEPADILHIHIGGNLTRRLLGLCLYCSQLPGRKTILTFHSGGYPSSPEGQATTANSFAAFVLRRLDAIIAVNRQIADFMIKCGADPARIHVISPHSLSAADAELPDDLRSFFAAHDPVLLSVGLLEPEYDLPLQIAALGEIRETHPEAALAMIGSGSLESSLRARISAQPYREHLLLPGDVPHPATLRAIRECAVLLRTTHYDGDSLSVREALALGTPVIATDNQMRPSGCRLIPSPALKPLVQAIEAALQEPRSAPTALSASRANLDAVLLLYRSLLERRG